MSAAPAGLDIGDRAPNFVLPDTRGTFTMFYERTRGLAVVLAFVPGPDCPAGGPLLHRLATLLPRLADLGVDVMAVSLAPAAVNAAAELPFLVWSDAKGKITEAYRSQLRPPTGAPAGEDRATLLLLDANQRVLALHHGGGASLADQALGFYDARPAPEAPEVRIQTAPVLLLPGVLIGLQCDQLCQVWSGQRGDELSPHQGHALPLEISDQAPCLHGLIGKRLAPEVYKAFGCETLRLASLTLRLHPARDRTDAAAPIAPSGPGANDLFQVFIALSPGSFNQPGFEFPEYSPHRYSVPRGGALVFSRLLQQNWAAGAEASALFLETCIQSPEPRP